MKEITPDKKREEYVRLAEHLRREASAIFRMAEELSSEAEELEGRVKTVAVKLKELSDHCEHHIEDMEPVEEEDEEPLIAEELIGKAYEKCLAARDFFRRVFAAHLLFGVFLCGETVRGTERALSSQKDVSCGRRPLQGDLTRGI